MKRLVMTLVLTGVLAISALAGEIPTSGSPSPTPCVITPAASTTAPGQTPSAQCVIPTTGAALQISDAALSAFLTVLGLLVL